MSLVEFQRKISQAQLQETIGNLNRGFSISGESKGAPNGVGAGAGDGGGGGGGDPNNLADPNYDMFDRRSIESRISYKSDNVFRSTMNYCVKYYKPNGTCMKNFFFKRFPFFSWIISYDIKECLLKDLVAGLTLGIVHIPQGMAYALMAGMPAINGLYVSFFNVILYVLFGTSRHLSTGTYAIVSLMVISSLNKYNGVLYPPTSDSHGGGGGGITSTLAPNKTTLVHSAATAASAHAVGSSAGYLSNDPTEAKVLIAGTLALLVGIIQCLFAIFHFGVVTKYLSDSIVNGFTAGAAFHVVVSQIPTLLGIKLGDTHLPVVLIGEFIEIFKNIAKTNLPTLIISLISMVFLYIIKVHVNEKYKEKLPVPVPVELILVVIATLASYLANFNTRYNVKTIGFLPLGIPKPSLPPLRIVPIVIGDSVAIAIVSYALNVSMAKLFAKKHKYEIRPNQELFAYGIGNVVSSFFKGFPGCVGLSRCAIMDSVGGKTQVNGIFTSILILIVLFVLAPLFKTLPNACLGAIIVIALKTMVLEVKIFPTILKRNKLEAMAWLATYLGVMILDVDVGLYIGVAFSLLLLIFRSQRARTSVLGNVPGTGIYESIDECEQAREFKTIKIIRYEESIYYANVDNFKYKIIKFAGVNPTTVLQKIKEETEKRDKLMKKLNQMGYNDNNVEGQGDPAKDIIAKIPLKHIIIDCSCINYIDSQGVNAIFQLYENYREIGITFSLSYCKLNVMRSFRKQSFKDKFDFHLIFTTTDDAVRHILRLEKEQKSATIIGGKQVFDAIEEELEDEPFPISAYKVVNDSHHNNNDEEFEPYVHRF